MKLIFSALFALTMLQTYAQSEVSGHISDQSTGEALPYANIYIAKLEKGTSTNDQGNFTFNNLPVGKHKVTITIIGYETLSVDLNVPTSEILQIELKPTAIEMEQIIISTPFHKLQSENVMKVERQSISQLQKNGATTLADGLNDVAGVNTISTGIGIGKPVIRGLSSNRVLVYTQGVRLENQQYGDEHGLGLNYSGIESVEIIKGPASLLYGSDALGGVLYFNPEKFASTNTASTDAGITYYSNTQGIRTNIGHKTSGDNFKFLFRGNFTEHSDYETKSYQVTNTRFKGYDFKSGLGYESTNFKTELRYNLNASKVGIPEEIGLQDNNRTPLLPFQQIENHIFSSKSKWIFNKSVLDINLGYTINNRREFEEHHHHEDEEHHDEDDHDEDEEHHDEDEHDEEEDFDDMDPALFMKLKTFNYDLKYHLPEYGKFETIVGIQGMHQTNSNYGEEQLIPNATTNDIGVLATSHIHFENLDIQLGARFDNRNININGLENKSFNSFNGALGFKTNLKPNLTLRLNLASGFRAPNLAELTSDGSHEGTNRYEIGNINLKSEQNLQTDLSLEYQNDHVEVYANGFYNTVSNYIFLSPDGTFIDDDPVFLYLQDDAKLYGGEIGIHFHPHPLDWLHVESSFETVTGKQDDGTYLPLIPTNSINNTLRVEFNTPWVSKANAFIKVNSVFDQNNVSGFETATSGYHLLNAGISGTLSVLSNELSFFVSGTNLANKRYVNHLSRLKPDGIFNMGRNISIGLSYKI